MGVRLTWADNNFNEDGHKVYRDTAPMDPQALPAPLATLSADITLFDDGTVVEGNTYYYRVSATLGGVEMVSNEVAIEVGATFDPSTLFAGGIQGAWGDISDLSTLFKDIAATDPVTADGDPVAFITDKSGNGNHMSQATLAKRPLYRTDGAYHWLEFDGVDDFLELNQVISGTQARTVCFGLTQADFADYPSSNPFLSLQTGSSQTSGMDWSPSLESSFFLRVAGNRSWNYNPSVPGANTQFIALLKWDTSLGTNVFSTVARLNAAGQTASGGVDATIDTNVTAKMNIGFSANQGSTYFNGRMYQMFIIRSLLNAADTNSIEQFIADKTGVAI